MHFSFVLLIPIIRVSTLCRCSWVTSKTEKTRINTFLRSWLECRKFSNSSRSTDALFLLSTVTSCHEWHSCVNLSHESWRSTTVQTLSASVLQYRLMSAIACFNWWSVNSDIRSKHLIWWKLIKPSWLNYSCFIYTFGWVKTLLLLAHEYAWALSCCILFI